MKKFSVCLLIIVIILSLCACSPQQVVDDEGISREVLYDNFVVLDEYSFNNYTMVVYHKTTLVVYHLQCDGYRGYLSPYQVYQDGAIYGAIFQDGEIIPVPYAYAPLE